MKNITKAIIPAAGFGTRFLPATKAVPKEMLPIVDIPTIQYIVEEAVNSGIRDILIVTSSYKTCIENHFDQSYELECKLLEKQDEEHYQMMERIASMANIFAVRQKHPRGLGHAILCGEAFIQNEPFAVLLGDDVVVNKEKGAIAQLMEAAYAYEGSVVGVQRVADAAVHKYGIVAPKEQMSERIVKLATMVEKPSLAHAPSNMAVLGRYVLEPEIFAYLKNQPPGAGNEIQLTDAIARLAQDKNVYACDFEGTRYDVGDKLGFLQAQIDFALGREDLHDAMAEIIRNTHKKLS
ncbi:MAG: UTP--glucose-1-phosphate uridylyltransferase GalU [Erysipelotrichaceae bacterium]|nr:UTP--glucose-1-phosphate uridylyltransferase GalU [Erysipelotrichaceae bacterium]